MLQTLTTLKTLMRLIDIKMCICTHAHPHTYVCRYVHTHMYRESETCVHMLVLMHVPPGLIEAVRASKLQGSVKPRPGEAHEDDEIRMPEAGQDAHLARLSSTR